MLSDNQKLTLQQEQQIQLNVLEFFDEICKKENIEYFLYAGTLLGAVREKGFISWDDDIDVCMKSEMVSKFIEAFSKYKNDYIFLQTFETDKNFFVPGVIRLCVKNTDKWGNEYSNAKFNKGIYFDIFVLSYNSADIKDNAICKKNALQLTKVGYVKNKSIEGFHIKQIIKKVLFSFLSISRLKNKYKTSIEKRNIDTSKRVIFISDYNGLERLTYNASCFDNAVEIDFMGKKYPCPQGYDEVLSTLYGADYMTPRKTKPAYHQPYLLSNDNKENPFLKNI